MKAPRGTLTDRLAALLADTVTARRDCRWQEWRNGQVALCRRTGCDVATCREPRRHLPTCRYGQWGGDALGAVGASCSPRCQLIRETLTEHEQQPALFA